MDTALQNQAHRMPQAPNSWHDTAEPDIADRSARQRVLSYWSQAERLLNQSINLPWQFVAYPGFSSSQPNQTVRPAPQIRQTMPTQQAPPAQQLIPPTRPSQLQVPPVQQSGPPAAIQMPLQQSQLHPHSEPVPAQAPSQWPNLDGLTDATTGRVLHLGSHMVHFFPPNSPSQGHKEIHRFDYFHNLVIISHESNAQHDGLFSLTVEYVDLHTYQAMGYRNRPHETILIGDPQGTPCIHSQPRL